jgi:hypothetical protein
MVGAFCKKQKPVVLSPGTALALVTWAGRRRCSICAALIGLSLTSAVLAQAPQPMTAEQIGKYRAKLAEYDAAQAEYRQLADRCWGFCQGEAGGAHCQAARAQAGHAPDDSGPKKPIDPSSPRRVVPIVADFPPAACSGAILVRARAAAKRDCVEEGLCCNGVSWRIDDRP